MKNNSNSLDPIAAVEQPRQDFIRYLLTAYPLRDPHLRYGLKQQLEVPGTVWQHPYLEGSQPYRPANSVNALVSQGVLHPEMASLFTPNQRPLYEHQENAVKAVIQQKQNIVVATGTGSGKTECFLIPMLDMLLKEEANLAIAGVRALILYPMNALVNDQVKRLRKLLCSQETIKIRFGFYTSRTENDRHKAEEALAEELQAYESEELWELFTQKEKSSLNLSTRERLIDEAIAKIQKIQAISRQEIWEKPPHILVTNYSMLEHMLIRPVERNKVFATSASTFKMLVVDEAHTYNGSTGSEVSMLIERLKVAVEQEKPGKIRCIATSASLGDASVNNEILEFATKFFGESFNQVIRGDRVKAIERLGEPYLLSAELTHEEILAYLSILELPKIDDDLSIWFDRLSGFVPTEHLKAAETKAQGDVHQFLWYALKQHPIVHRLIEFLSRQPQPWEKITQSTEFWCVNLPFKSDGTIDDTETKFALAHLLQLGTLARENSESLPLLPVRIHLLFRSLEGMYACINPQCPGGVCDPNYEDKPRRYGRLYLNEKRTCDDCNSPVLELGSCYQCGQAYAFTQINGVSKLEPLPRSNQGLRENDKIYTLTSGLLDSITEEEEIGEEEQESSPTNTLIIRQRDGWIGLPTSVTFTNKSSEPNEFYLAWHRPRDKDAKDLSGCYLPRCAACGTRPIRAQAINRFVAYTDEPLEAMIDSLFDLLPESQEDQGSASKRKLLTFSDGRQDAAFFASDYQRTHTETVYRQIIWQAFQELNPDDDIVSINQLINKVKQQFLETSIPHPDRDSRKNYLSYYPDDEESLENYRDCQDSAEARAKELLLREFALPFNRRSTLEAYALFACHIELRDERLIELVAREFEISNAEAKIFLIVLTDIIRRTGIVSIDGASRYFPETGGVEGVRPEMVDIQGRSKNYLFLEKSPDEQKKFKDSPSFIPKWKQKTGEVSQVQNRLGWYYLQLFGDNLPNRDKFVALFKQLEQLRLLEKAKNGHQLNWTRLNIIKTQHDWYQCDRCQQIIHVPGLSDVQKSQTKLNIFGCPAFKCTGQLQPYYAEKIEQVRNEHYQQYIIKNRLPLPLRSQEHTAQLGVTELERRENRFRRGQINLLSCSTTLEMGVDIGELQAVVLRNFPPHVSNYQQRAGRAGRRTDGVAITLMYGQRRPHDRFYFEQPEQLIAGSNQIPKLDADNFQIQQRHIRAELLAEFLKTKERGAEKVTIAEFFSLPVHKFDSLDTPPPTAIVSELQEWLHSDDAHNLAQLWINKLKISYAATDILNQFVAAILVFQQAQLADWNDLVLLLKDIQDSITAETDRTKRKGIEKRRDGIEAELEKIGKRRLHDELVQASILPIYGFPIDVVRLLTGESDEFKSSQGKHRLERDRRLALGEYAPSQDIVVDDRVYQSVGILRPSDLEQKYYWVCKNCNHFESSISEQIIEQCSVCGCKPTPAAAGKMKLYKVPKAFTTDWSVTPKVTPYTKPQRQLTSQVFLAKSGEDQEQLESEFYKLTVNKGGILFLANQGSLGRGKGFSKEGFAICQYCGRDLSELVQKQREANNAKGGSKKASSKASSTAHKHPITAKDCSGTGYPHIHLGHEFRSDLLKIEFQKIANLKPLFGDVVHYGDGGTVASVTEQIYHDTDGMAFWRSLTYALIAAAAQVIDVPRSELDGLFTPLPNQLAQIIIYDNVPGGAGYSKRIADHFFQVLEKALEITASCSCDTSCYDCLRTYSNQPFHAELNRKIVANFLTDLVVKPDPELQAFAPNANRVKLSQMATRVPAICRMAGKESMIYLPSLIDTFNLNNGSPLPWLKLLKDAVYSMQRSNIALELILNQLPEPNTAASDATRRNLQLLQKHLQQWVDQELLKLYQTSVNDVPILCLSTQQQNRIALQLHQQEWFETRSGEGVDTVFQRLQNLRSQARPVEAIELEDPNTTVIFPDRTWSNLTITQLRQRLGIDRVFSGGGVKIVYRDRYLNEKGGKILADLLQGDGINENSSVTIWVLEDYKGELGSQRKANLEAALTQIQRMGVSTTVKVQPWYERSYFPHSREMEVLTANGQRYKIMFDKGMDFLELKATGVYSVTESTYVVINKQD
ncbi:DEAD/DEAH box helicase [Trichormus variabilis ARAD]|uniref:DEAD/DEAH box helicase n=1 Tax=Anabaena variabilis TaxID=264691 RepID=UPI00162334CE|nr:DEAD/DEAH box helicase [Trichormus variabilis]MBC1212935.1 DEAD/DEAH box helicase [Trichormus variabilis ARAD]